MKASFIPQPVERLCAGCGKSLSIRWELLNGPTNAVTVEWVRDGDSFYCNVRCKKRKAGEFWAYVKHDEGCWPWTGPVDRSTGYGRVPKKIAGVRDRAHRVAYRLAKGPIPKGKLVCHKCDNPLCCRPSHLFLGTIRDNILDMWAKGRGRTQFVDKRGEKGPGAKLTKEQVAEIRRLYRPGHAPYPNPFGTAALAKRFGVNKTTISRIVRVKTWAA